MFPFTLMLLPYGQMELNPHISPETVSVHYEKHHKGYVNTLNAILEAHPEYQNTSLVQLIKKTYDILHAQNAAQDPRHAIAQSIFNNAAQIWNHDFYWHSISAQAAQSPQGIKPHGALAQRINQDFGSLEGLCEALVQAASGQFGSGWVFLARRKDGSLSIIKTGNAQVGWLEEPTSKMLLVCDVWEHAYYLDYKNERKRYAETFWRHLANWDLASQRYEKAETQSLEAPFL